jgi:hypothetical protein
MEAAPLSGHCVHWPLAPSRRDDPGEDLLIRVGEAHRDVPQQRVAVYPDHAGTALLGHSGHLIVQVA